MSQSWSTQSMPHTPQRTRKRSVLHTSSNSSPQPVKKIQKNFKKNYASVECGARILAANHEATRTAGILMENMDLYMLSPCSNEIWFVVGLCESIQVKQLDIANFELFSSMPKDFLVSISDRCFSSHDDMSLKRKVSCPLIRSKSFQLPPSATPLRRRCKQPQALRHNRRRQLSHLAMEISHFLEQLCTSSLPLHPFTPARILHNRTVSTQTPWMLLHAVTLPESPSTPGPSSHSSSSTKPTIPITLVSDS